MRYLAAPLPDGGFLVVFGRIVNSQKATIREQEGWMGN
jgi:hypothetical protein